MSRPVVITGASGFVGRALLEELRRNGVPVTGVARSRVPGLLPVADYASTPVPAGAVLVHLAQRRDASVLLDTSEIALCEALAAKPWQHIVYASSAIVYGDLSAHPRRPEEPVAASSDYARVKVACEDVFGRVGATSIRLSNLYGPGMGVNTVIGDILRQIPGEGPLMLRDPAPVRDFLWITDAARCLAAACTVMPGGILNAGSGRGIAVGELAQLALTLAGQGTRRVVGEKRPGHVSCLTLDISKTRSVIDWTPGVDLAMGLSTLLSAARQ